MSAVKLSSPFATDSYESREKSFPEDDELRWSRYCGFFDLTLEEFRAIQNELLGQQLVQASRSAIYHRFFGDERLRDVSEFLAEMPLTTYEDYADYLNNKDDVAAGGRVSSWVFTSTTAGAGKWVPYTNEALEHLLDSSIAAVLQASATHKGEINIKGGETILNCIAPSPFLTGLIFDLLGRSLGLRVLPPSREEDIDEFSTRIKKGLQMAVPMGLDIVGSLPSVLVKIGEMTSDGSGRPIPAGASPRQLCRLARAYFSSKLTKRRLLPRDIWHPRALLSWGLDTDSYRPLIREYWGVDPLEFYGCTEAGILAMQSFNRKGMTLIPHSGFLEFIPEEEWTFGHARAAHPPATVFVDGLEVGKRYEVVLTSFYGMPFLRYRVGHLIKVVSIGDRETGASLPQIALAGRADQTIDIGGFTRLDERTLLDALSRSPFDCRDWIAAKEIHDGAPFLSLYVELNGAPPEKQVLESLHRCLKTVDPGYRDLERLLGINPLRIKVLPPGTFQRYREKKKRQGADPIASRLARINPPSQAIDELVYC